MLLNIIDSSCIEYLKIIENDVKELEKHNGFANITNLIASSDATTRKRAVATLCNISAIEQCGSVMRKHTLIESLCERMKPEHQEDISVLENITCTFLNTFIDEKNREYFVGLGKVNEYLNNMIKTLEELVSSGLVDEQNVTTIYNLLIALSSLCLESTIGEQVMKLGGVTFLCSLICKINAGSEEDHPQEIIEGVTACLWNLLLIENVKRFVMIPNLNQNTIDTKILVEKLIILSNSKFANVKRNTSHIIQILSSKLILSPRNEKSGNNNTPSTNNTPVNDNLFESSEMIQKLLTEIKQSASSIKINDIEQVKTSSGILWNMAGNSREVRDKIREQKGLEILCSIILTALKLSSKNMKMYRDVVYKVTGAMASLSLDEENALIMGSNSNLIPSLLNSLQLYPISESDNFTTLENVLTLLNNLSIVKENRKQIYELRGIPIVIQFLKSYKSLQELKIAEKASNILTNMAIDDESSNSIREEGGIESLVSIVSIDPVKEDIETSESPIVDVNNVKKKAAHTLWNLMLQDENLKRIEEVGGLKPLVHLLPETNLEELVESQLRKKEEEVLSDISSDDEDDEVKSTNSSTDEEEVMAFERQSLSVQVEEVNNDLPEVKTPEKPVYQPPQTPSSSRPTREQSAQVRNILRHWGSISGEEDSIIQGFNASEPLVSPKKQEPEPAVVVIEPVKTPAKEEKKEVVIPTDKFKKAAAVHVQKQDTENLSSPVKERKFSSVIKTESTVKPTIEKKKPVVTISKGEPAIIESTMKYVEEKPSTPKQVPVQKATPTVKPTEEVEEVKIKEPEQVKPEPIVEKKPEIVKPIIKNVEPIPEPKKVVVETPKEQAKLPSPATHEKVHIPSLNLHTQEPEQAITPKTANDFLNKSSPSLGVDVVSEFTGVDSDSDSQLDDTTPSAFEASTFIEVTQAQNDSDSDSDVMVDENRDDMDILANIGVQSHDYLDDMDDLSVSTAEKKTETPNSTPRQPLTPKKPNGEITLDRRVEKITNFYQSEKLYLSILEIIDKYLVTNENIKQYIGKQEHSEIFSDFDCIRMINKDLFTELENVYTTCNDDPKKIDEIQIGRLILKRVPTMRLYKTYSNNLERLLQTLAEIESKNTAYSSYYDKTVLPELVEAISEYQKENYKYNPITQNSARTRGLSVYAGASQSVSSSSSNRLSINLSGGGPMGTPLGIGSTIFSNGSVTFRAGKSIIKLSDVLSKIPIERVQFYGNWLQEMAFKLSDSTYPDQKCLHEAYDQMQAISDHCLDKFTELEKLEQFSQMLAGNLLSQNRKYFVMDNLGFPEPQNLNEYKLYQQWKKSYTSKSKKLEKEWTKKNINEMLSNPSGIKNLIKKYGISPIFRPRIWMEISGAQQKLNENTGYYKKILSVHGNKNKTPWLDQIEKDLKRTYVQHPYFNNDEKVQAALRRVLIAYCWRNPLVSYSQSFNYIAGLMLLHLSEEEVFWLFVAILEDYLPANYYSPELKGVLVDAMVFDELLSVNLYKLACHFKSIDFEISTFTMSFFMKLFTVDFPIETTLRFWDAFLCYGSQMMFRTVLAILKLNQDALLKTTDVSEIMLTMQDIVKTQFDCQKIMKTAFGFSKITRKGSNIEKEVHSSH